MEKIHVLHVVGMMDFGGTEALLMNLLQTVDRNQYQFDFVEQVQEECAHDSEILALGSRIYRCPHISPKDLKSYRSWWRGFFAEHPEYLIVHGHSRGSGPIYMDEARRAGRIVIAHCHSSSHGRGLKGAIRYLWQLPLRRLGDYNFACSEDAGISQYGKRADYTVLKNGIITGKFAWNETVRQEVRKALEIDNGTLVIGNVARFEPPKNHAFLVRIFAELHRLCPDSKLMLVGSGSLEEKIRAQVHEAELDDCVIFTGSSTDVYKFYQAMDAFVLPSFYEGVPLVLIEAQTAGLPSFTSDKVVAPESKVTDLLHFISLEESAQQWAKCIMETLPIHGVRKDHTPEVRAAGYDIEDTTNYLCDFYRKVLREHGKA